MSLIPTKFVFGRDHRLPYDLLFGAPLRRQGTTKNRLRNKCGGPSTRHPQLCPRTLVSNRMISCYY
jgi:hypothetical protein